MEDLLMVRTFSIVGGMLVISSIGARLNKAYETFWEKFWTILGFFLSLVLIIIYSDTFPHNLIACGIFSAFGGWSLGPSIGYIGERFKWRKYLKDKGVKSKDLNRHSGFWGTTEEKHIVYYFEGDEENCEQWKKVWIQEKLLIKPNVVFIKREKGELAQYKDKPNILIVDRPHNIEDWESNGGHAIRFQANEDPIELVINETKRILSLH